MPQKEIINISEFLITLWEGMKQEVQITDKNYNLKYPEIDCGLQPEIEEQYLITLPDYSADNISTLFNEIEDIVYEESFDYLKNYFDEKGIQYERIS